MGSPPRSGARPAPLSAEATTPTLFADEDRREAVLRAAAEVLDADGVVVLPTETFYGLAARADRPAAVARLAAFKARGGDKPLPLLAGLRRDVDRLGALPAALEPLAQAFWPGPLTLVLPVRGDWPAPLSAGTGTVGVRISSHPWARRLAALAGGIITATSANSAGGEPPTSVARLAPEVVAAVQLVLDGGLCAGGRPSTVVGERDGRVVVLRPGAVGLAELAGVLGEPPAVVGG